MNGSRDGFHGPTGEKTDIRSSSVGQERASPAMSQCLHKYVGRRTVGSPRPISSHSPPRDSGRSVRPRMKEPCGAALFNNNVRAVEASRVND
jgi:hypothetical protein